MIRQIIWPHDRIEHIAKHGVSPAEFEEICFGRPLVMRTRSEGTNPVYVVLGQTDSGRYLLCVVIRFADGKGYPVTARDMKDNERRRYREWRSR